MKKAFPLIILFSLMFTAVSAQETEIREPEYKLLAPLPGVETSPDSGESTATTYIRGLFQLMIMIAGVLAVVMIIYGGVEYMSTDAFTGKSAAKDRISNAIWGLLLAIGSWLILYTIDEDLVNFNLTIGTVEQFEPAEPPEGGDDTSLPPEGGGLGQNEAYEQLINGGITVLPATLTLAGLRQATIDEVLRLRAECDCPVVLTSATGGSHRSGDYSHANGYKVDLRNTNEGRALTNFILENYTEVAPRVNPPARMFRGPTGALYALESNHWDVVIR